MTVAILLISHNQIASELINTAQQMLAPYSVATTILSISIDDNPDDIRLKFMQTLHEIDQGDGTLILTDMYGSTPSNIACGASERHDIRIISGLNLPMLIRVLNYPHLNLNELEQKAITGGQDGVVSCHHTECRT
jgi:PTS system mannose-specific IIA component|tara:strand:- start:1807 stop:2211 length:405 start_codon:yes stop_codon:yes gene_type:complete